MKTCRPTTRAVKFIRANRWKKKSPSPIASASGWRFTRSARTTICRSFAIGSGSWRPRSMTGGQSAKKHCAGPSNAAPAAAVRPGISPRTGAGNADWSIQQQWIKAQSPLPVAPDSAAPRPGSRRRFLRKPKNRHKPAAALEGRTARTDDPPSAARSGHLPICQEACPAANWK